MASITREQLRQLILETSMEAADPYKVYFASRPLFADWSPVHHAWVMLTGPEGTTSLSGKSGAAFIASRFLDIDWKSLGQAGIEAVLGRPGKMVDIAIDPSETFREFGRDEGPDEVYWKAIANAESVDTKEAWQAVKDAMEDTTWKNLQKRDNYKSDVPSAAAVKKQIPPPEGMSGKEFQDRLRAAYDSYEEDILYDPAPEISTNSGDRNSNSFAYSLLRSAYGGVLPPGVEVDTMHYPGSSQLINFDAGPLPNPDLKLPVAESTLREYVRHLILEGSEENVLWVG